MVNSKLWRLILTVFGVVIVGVGSWFVFKTETGTLNKLAAQRQGLTESTINTVLDELKSSPAKVVFLNVWATWCGPCQEEIPLLLELEKDYGPLGFQLIFFSADNKSDEEEVKAVIEKQSMRHSFFRGKSPMADLEQIYPGWSGALPVSVLFDDGRTIVKRWMGTASEAEFRDEIEAALGLQEDNE